MLDVGFGRYTVMLAVGRPPEIYDEIVARAVLHDDFGIRGSEGESIFVAVRRDDADWPYLALSFRQGNLDFFHFCVHVVEETNLLLVGSGTRLLAYDLETPRKLWSDETGYGVLRWGRHNDVVLMSAELDLAAYSLHGERLWTRFVEPPWNYKVVGDRLELDVMGELSMFSLHEGP